jgi:Leucine-rich repeat (LRR) protein
LSDKELHSLTIFETNVDQNDDSSPKIKSLRGIEKLKYLEEVKVYGNSIRGALDISDLSALTRLECGGNKITSIVLPEESRLKVLECSLDPITFLDLKGQTELEELACPMSSLKTLDLTNQTKLEWLNVGSSALTSLILPGSRINIWKRM